MRWKSCRRFLSFVPVVPCLICLGCTRHQSISEELATLEREYLQYKQEDNDLNGEAGEALLNRGSDRLATLNTITNEELFDAFIATDSAFKAELLTSALSKRGYNFGGLSITRLIMSPNLKDFKRLVLMLRYVNDTRPSDRMQLLDQALKSSLSDDSKRTIWLVVRRTTPEVASFRFSIVAQREMVRLKGGKETK